MIRSLNQYIKLPLLLFLVDIEASELEKSRKEKLQLRNEIVRTVPVSSPPNSHKPLTLPSLLEGVDKNFSLLLAAFQDMEIVVGDDLGYIFKNKKIKLLDCCNVEVFIS